MKLGTHKNQLKQNPRESAIDEYGKRSRKRSKKQKPECFSSEKGEKTRVGGVGGLAARCYMCTERKNVDVLHACVLLLAEIRLDVVVIVLESSSVDDDGGPTEELMERGF